MGDAEQLYCYCNGPSHGEMVACDMPGCEKEWFHLECVGLTKPPSTKCEILFLSLCARCGLLIFGYDLLTLYSEMVLSGLSSEAAATYYGESGDYMKDAISCLVGQVRSTVVSKL